MQVHPRLIKEERVSGCKSTGIPQIITRNIEEHDEELPAALENHNTFHPLRLRASKRDKVNESFWIKLLKNKDSDNY